jgi:hypothetical protein
MCVEEPLNELPGDLTKYGAFYYAGLTIEADPESKPPRLSIDGQKVEISRLGDRGPFVYPPQADDFKSEMLGDLAKQLIEVLWDRKGRERIRDEHVERLKDRDSWNEWRRKHPDVRPLLFEAKLCGRDRNFEGFNFCNANLIRACLREARLKDANFHEANLGGAHLNDADLTNANFCRTDLYETDFSHKKSSTAKRTNLTGANLQGTQLARTIFTGAQLVDCKIYGLSAWNIDVGKAKQANLKVLYRVRRPDGNLDQGEFPVDDLEFAQLVFLLLDNTKINKLFNQLTSKAVVILSRFNSTESQQVIEKLRSGLLRHGFVPIVFDFKRSKDRDLTETIKTLVGLCHFAIADLTNPRSVPLELYATIKDYQVPFVPIIKAGQDPFALFHDFEKFSWMLKTLTYKSPESFSEDVVKRCIIDRATVMWKRIRRSKGRSKRAQLSIEEYYAKIKKQS